MVIGVLKLQLEFPGCKSLKEKRGRLKPLITRLHREFNISVAELAQQDVWYKTTIGCVMISNEHPFTERSLQTVVHWLNKNWPDVLLMDDQIEIIN